MPPGAGHHGAATWRNAFGALFRGAVAMDHRGHRPGDPPRRRIRRAQPATGRVLTTHPVNDRAVATPAIHGWPAAGHRNALPSRELAAELDVLAGPPSAACRSTGDRVAYGPVEHQVVRRGIASGVEDEQVWMVSQPPLVAGVIVLETLHRGIIHHEPTEQHTLVADERTFTMCDETGLLESARGGRGSAGVR